jgi:hypothetical protein
MCILRENFGDKGTEGNHFPFSLPNGGVASGELFSAPKITLSPSPYHAGENMGDSIIICQ